MNFKKRITRSLTTSLSEESVPIRICVEEQERKEIEDEQRKGQEEFRKYCLVVQRYRMKDSTERYRKGHKNICNITNEKEIITNK